jgi:hypothetical protein
MVEEVFFPELRVDGVLRSSQSSLRKTAQPGIVHEFIEALSLS